MECIPLYLQDEGQTPTPVSPPGLRMSQQPRHAASQASRHWMGSCSQEGRREKGSICLSWKAALRCPTSAARPLCPCGSAASLRDPL